MGTYLSKPVTEKVSGEEANERVAWGASSMQGWRITQEDAHNCILDFDDGSSFFAVYDGHGGPEVAAYCADKLPDLVKDTEAYKEGNMEKALVDAFLGLDATIATSEVVDKLKKIAMAKKVNPPSDEEAVEDEEEEEEVDENMYKLYKEAVMPLEEVIEKYTTNSTQVKRLRESEGKPLSPFLRAHRDEAGSSGSSSSSSLARNLSCASPTTLPSAAEKKIEEEKDVVAETNHSNEPETVAEDEPAETKEKVECEVGNEKENSVLENGQIERKRKATDKTKGMPVAPERSRRQPRLAKPSTIMDLDSEDSEDEDDKTFVEPTSSDDDEQNDSLEQSSLVEDDESEDSSEPEEESEEDVGCNGFFMREEPGSDSGCTAVVALLQGNKLYVANAGDSRCIVCRNGKAVEMSFDHKPEDDPERERVVKAGGKVTADGRVNGGLNLSRAIGDHAYKQNKELSDREQMITALPDVRTLTIDPAEDEFMVLACDGIWNSLSSQQVVDFVIPRVKPHRDRLSLICEELFDECLAPTTAGDGTGCDNMTAIVVIFKSVSGGKRPASPGTNSVAAAKRPKTDETSTAANAEHT